MRVDPANYQPVVGVEYARRPPSLYRWEITREKEAVVGLLGVFPLARLIPHERTTAAALTRPRHPVQIRPVMALVDEPLPEVEPLADPIVFTGTHRHTVTPIAPIRLEATTAIIADGHHRAAAALREGGDPGIMTLVVDAATADLEAGAFHRVFARPVPLPDQIDQCDLIEEPPEASLAAGRLAVVTPRGARGVAVDGDAVPAPLRGIPAALAARFLYPALGLAEAGAVYLDSMGAALAAASYGTAVLLPGSDVRSVVAAARSGLDLPPKATRFRPKPLRGLVMRPL